jgi:hypothetical protein
MYEKIKEEIKQDYYQQNYPNDGQRFVAWYVRNIHSLDLNQTKYAITDGADDKQIDAIVIDDDNSTIYIIQGKFVGSEQINAEPIREVLASWVQLKNMIRLQETGNPKLRQRLSDAANALEDEYDIVFELVTTSNLTQPAKEDLATFQQELAQSDDFAASLFLIDSEELERRYDLALERENPLLKHSIHLENGKYAKMRIAQTDVVMAAIPLKDCLRFPGIKDGTLFQKNVRQSLGLNNTVNKQIKNTIYSDRHRDFFFYHNGITAICNEMNFEEPGGALTLKGISVVNGCQSLTTILSCSEKVKTLEDTYVMFRFYEIPQRDRADKISFSTNSQSTVKPRDLRSNDKRILALKKAFEQRYRQGTLITKRGEQAPAEKDKNYIIDLSNLGKYLIAWHSQRPNISYSETKIFDKYFEQLFKRDYSPENIQSLNFWMQKVYNGWVPSNPFGLNESLLAMKAYAPFHQLYAISMCFAVASNLRDRVPNPTKAYQRASEMNVVDRIVNMAATCLNFALETAANQTQPGTRVFSPQNWVKTKTCLSEITNAISMQLMMLASPNMPGGIELKESLTLPAEHFEYRWAAD